MIWVGREWAVPRYSPVPWKARIGFINVCERVSSLTIKELTQGTNYLSFGPVVLSFARNKKAYYQSVFSSNLEEKYHF